MCFGLLDACLESPDGMSTGMGQDKSSDFTLSSNRGMGIQLPGQVASPDESRSRKADDERALTDSRPVRRQSTASERSEISTPDSKELIDVNCLLENDVSRALRMQSEQRSSSQDFKAFLSDLGFEVVEEPGPTGSTTARLSTISKDSNLDLFDLQTSEKEHEMFYVREIFGPPTKQSQVDPRHLRLMNTVKSVFSLGQAGCFIPEACFSSASLDDHDSHSVAFNFKVHVQAPARRIVRHKGFMIFFMFLTVYALFGMDLFDALGNSDQELPFVILNTVVFLLFGFELLMHSLGVPRYVCSMEFVLDSVALVSVFTETWFIRVELLDDEQAGVMRLGRSSRVARLARLARIARLTKMMLHGTICTGRRKWDVAKLSLMRRLWRIFCFLDPERDRRITAFDMKCFYMALLRSHPCFTTAQSRISVLSEDARWFNKEFSHRLFLKWDEFVQDFLSTSVGRRVLEEHAKEVEGDESAFALTKKVSDSSALRICVVVLVLLGAITFFDSSHTVYSKRAAPLGLAGLEFVARHEAADASLLCDSIETFRKRYNVKFLVLDGHVRWEDGHCVGGRVTIDSPFREMKRLVEHFKLRRDDFYIVCVPEVEDCSTVESRLSSVCLIDSSAHNRSNAGRVLLSTTLVVILLVVFISIMSAKMGHYAKTMLRPLQTLLDDMNVLSNLELAHVDEDMPYVGIEPDRLLEDVQELSGLQENSKALRNAIRSWSKYVPPMVVQRLFAAGLEAEIGVAKITATILFCDLIGFEEACLGLRPEDVLKVLSTALGTISDVITQNHGTLLEFIGDEVLAVFNAPSKLKHHVYAGVVSALDIHSAADQLPEMVFKGGQRMRVRCRCGVHTGAILAGNIGSHRRMKYGLLGDSINLTARLKTLNSRYSTQTLISEQAVSDEFCANYVGSRPVDIVAVKGKKKPTVVYEAMRKDSGEVSQASEKHCEAFRLYQERKFVEAARLFSDVALVMGESDGPSQMLKGRCDRYAKEPPPADWDGVERLNAKSFH